MSNRPYTGLTDISGSQKPAIQAVEDMVAVLSHYFGMKKVGTVNSNLNSVHASGRAFDIRAYDFKKKQWARSNFEEPNWNLINFLYLNRVSLGIEEIHDYIGLYIPKTMTRYDGSNRGSTANYGAGYRCNRENQVQSGILPGWRKWDLNAHQSSGGDSVGLKHVHIEVSPQAASSGISIVNKVNRLADTYVKKNWKLIQISGQGINTIVKTITRT